MIIMGWAMEETFKIDTENTVYYGYFSTEEKRMAYCLFVFVIIGVSEVLGGQILGVIRDRTSNRLANILLIILTCIAVAFLLIFTLQKEWSYVIYFLLFFWGFQDSSLNVMMNTILGFEFDSKTVPFGVYKMF